MTKSGNDGTILQSDRTANRSPSVTVIIPVRNEVCFIDRCLQSVFSGDPVPGDLEIIVVDGMSDDGTRQILADWCRRQPKLQVLDNPHRIVPTAMNIGIRTARGEWIIRLDAHAEYPPNYLALCLEIGQRTGADNVGGTVTTLSHQQNIRGKLVQALTTHRFGVGNAGFRIGASEGWVDTVPYGCFRREVFEHIGLYDERLVRNQDYELNRRLLRAGGCIWYNPTIQIKYYNQSTLKGLLHQAFITGQWNPWMWYTAPYSFAWRHAVPFVFVGVLLSTFGLLFIAPHIALFLFKVIFVSYFGLALSASFKQSIHYGIWMFVFLPFLFFAYHLAYGLGSLWALCLLFIKRAPVQIIPEPWPGAGSYRVWPLRNKQPVNQ